MHVEGIFSVSNWAEKGLGDETRESLVSQVSATFTVIGQIDGEITVNYLMHSLRRNPSEAHDADVTYLGYLAFAGSISHKCGSFIMEDKGIYSIKGPESFFTIKPHSGTGDFEKISGEGRYYAKGDQMVIELTYSV